MSFSRKEYFTNPYRVAEGSMASRDNTDNIRFVVWTSLATVVLGLTIFFMPIFTNHGFMDTKDYFYFQMIGMFWKHSALLGVFVFIFTICLPVYAVMEAEYTWRCLSVDDPKFEKQMGRMRLVRYLAISAAFVSIATIVGVSEAQSFTTDPGALLMLLSIIALCAQPIYVQVIGREVLRSQTVKVPVEAD